MRPLPTRCMLCRVESLFITLELPRTLNTMTEAASTTTTSSTPRTYEQQELEQMAVVRTCTATKVPIELCYKTYGDKTLAADRTLLVIGGLNGHMGMFDPEYMGRLAVEGNFYVINFDNRDAGRSTKLDQFGSPWLVTNLIPTWMMFGYDHPLYTLHDMAEDAWALLDHLGVTSAHLMGASMGGMIAQCMAIEHPERTKSLISIFSQMSPNAHPGPSLWTRSYFLTAPKSHETEDMVAYKLYFAKNVILSINATEEDMKYVERRTRAQLARTTYARGMSRQVAAIRHGPCREAMLKEKLHEMPILIFHGTDDRLVPFENGHEMAMALNRVRFIPVQGAGHALMPNFWEVIIREVKEFLVRPPVPGGLAANSAPATSASQ